MATFKAVLLVRPRPGVRDPQGEAVGEALSGIGYGAAKVECVGRTLHFSLDAKDATLARAQIDEMCKRLLVNPSLETYELTLAGG